MRSAVIIGVKLPTPMGKCAAKGGTVMSELMKVAPYSKIRFYQLLTEKFGEQGKNALFIGFHLYAFRKGIRCAQRVVSKGLPLSYDSYQLCREAVCRTAEARKLPGQGGKSTREVYDGETVSRIYSCGTADCFREFGAPAELEELYCRNVDLDVNRAI